MKVVGKNHWDVAEMLVVVRGGGDLATGVIQKFFRTGFKVLVLEVEKPLAIRRTVSLCAAVYAGTYQVEDMTARVVDALVECDRCWEQGEIPIFVDPAGRCLNKTISPAIVVDAILAKRNLGTHRVLAPITIALGPGFQAGVDVDVVIETLRGHHLGRLYFTGEAMPNTGIPGELGGESAARVLHAPAAGVIKHVCKIGDTVNKGDILFYIEEMPVHSPLKGTLRGLIQDGLLVGKGLKCADVDPRSPDVVDCKTISDKARALGGAALEAALIQLRQDG
ncbi:MAG: selenium-dependent molybdenum cofactor biosynthesis protein YqeB [Lachnospiraceae bacterium]|nr:selenium-dependent molybdenum cofactor biosynthesis protein YqeB [Lachnospiraceae bacterium]